MLMAYLKCPLIYHLMIMDKSKYASIEGNATSMKNAGATIFISEHLPKDNQDTFKRSIYYILNCSNLILVDMY